MADRYGAVVISDEIHGPFVLDRDDGEHVPFASLDTEASARSVCLHSASKGWNLPGLKAAIMVAGSERTRKRLESPALGELGERAGIAGVAAGVAAFDEAEPWLDDAVAYIAGNHRLVREVLPDALPGVRVRRAEATYLMWLDLRAVPALTGAAEPADVLLDRARVALVPGPQFGRRYTGWARMNLGTSRPILQEAISRMASAIA